MIEFSPGLSEVLAGPCGGLVLHGLLAEARAAQHYAVLIDGMDGFDPAGVPGLCLMEHLLWVRCAHWRQALTAADLVLRDENFPWVVLDLRGVPERSLKGVPLHTWYRLQRLAGHHEQRLVALTEAAVIRAAQSRYALQANFSLEALETSAEMLEEAIVVETLKEHSGGTWAAQVAALQDVGLERAG